MPKNPAASQNRSYAGRNLQSFRGGNLTSSCRRKAGDLLCAHLGHLTLLDEAPKADDYYSVIGLNHSREAANRRALPDSIVSSAFDK
jgi:hypothetical protein